MTQIFIRRLLVSAAALGLGVVSSSSQADPDHRVHAGRASVYQKLPNGSLEAVSSPEVIRAMFARDTGQPVVAPSRIWKVLEHGEKVECLSCISLVSGLLYDSHPKTREIAAWWLRRRVFGVFGPGQVYSQVVATVGDRGQPEYRRVRAANALGEFLTLAGAKHLASAVREDPSALVREAAVRALERMNHQGPGQELAFAMRDADPKVRLAAVRAATRVNVFSGVEALAERIADESPAVRREAAAALGSMRAADAVDGLIALTSPDMEPEALVRKAAVWSLGQIGDPIAASAVEAALGDPDPFVRDAARAVQNRLY